MRKITRQITEAFANRQAKRSGNDEVTVHSLEHRRPHLKCVRLWLHRNKIAEQVFLDDHGDDFGYDTDILTVTLSGWGTNTTRERLTGLMTTLDLPIHFTQHKHEQYIRTATKGRKIGETEIISIDLNTGEEVKK